MAAEIAMLHDVSRCTACRACMVACKQWKDLPAEKTPFEGDFQSHKNLNPNTLNLIRMKESYTDGKVRWDFLKYQCMHCGEPSCAKACPEGALQKEANGVVAWTEDKCVGCGYCERFCPFDVPKIDHKREKASKCNLCADRIENGKIPSCAQTCTARAILFGSREDMVAEANKRLEQLKPNYPNAQLYGVDKNGVGGTTMMYILTDKPSTYGLPDNPSVPVDLTLWKDLVQPAGKLILGATLGAIAVSAVSTRILGAKEQKGEKQDG